MNALKAAGKSHRFPTKHKVIFKYEFLVLKFVILKGNFLI